MRGHGFRGELAASTGTSGDCRVDSRGLGTGDWGSGSAGGESGLEVGG